MSILDGLNKEQKKAAEKIEGPLLILAGAGSGKTRTVTYRIAYMINEKNISPINILALTFTNKAAAEMRDRVKELIDFDTNNLVISTFHSFSVKTLRIYGEKIGYGKNFNIYDSNDQKALAKKILKELNIDDENITPSKIISKISKLKEGGVTEKNFEEYYEMKVPYNRLLHNFYIEYNKRLKSSNAMDFSDLLVNMEKLLSHQEILENLQNRYRYIMVDEYQDTNNIQYRIVNKIAMKYRNICVVGDEDQSIYSFRGADIQNILNFEKDYKDAYVVKLEQNYRSTKRILNIANHLIKNNESSKGKNLWTDGNEGDKIKIYEANNAYDEARFIIQEIEKEVSRGIELKDITILYRTNAQSRILEEALLNRNIKYKIYGGMQFFQRQEIKDLLGYLSVINNPNDEINLLRIINTPKRKIGLSTIQKLEEYRIKNDLSMFEAIKNVEKIETFNSATKTKLLDFYNIMAELIDLSEELTVKELIDETLSKTKYIEKLEDRQEDRVGNIEELLNSIVEIEKENPDMLLSEYLESVSLNSPTDEIEDSENFIKLMTIHSSKGLEFDYVFVAGLEEGLFPSEVGEYDGEELEEERRLCYVAVTRAKKNLYLTHSKERMIWGQVSYMRMKSRFIDEMLQEELDYLNNFTKNTKNISNIYTDKTNNSKIENFNPFKKLSKNETENSKYKRGQNVNHKKFGKGKIIGIDEKSLTIDFIVGKKKIALILADKILEV